MINLKTLLLGLLTLAFVNANAQVLTQDQIAFSSWYGNDHFAILDFSAASMGVKIEASKQPYEVVTIKLDGLDGTQFAADPIITMNVNTTANISLRVDLKDATYNRATQTAAVSVAAAVAGYVPVTIDFSSALAGINTAAISHMQLIVDPGNTYTGEIYIKDLTFGSTVQGVSSLAAMEIVMSPNPTDDVVNITLPAGLECNIAIVDLTGKEVIVLNGQEGIVSVNVSDLNKGTYLVAVKNAAEVTTNRLLVIK